MFKYSCMNSICEGIHYMTGDTSIIYRYRNKENLQLDYTISLGENPRYLLDMSHKTGKCGPLRCFMAGAKIMKTEVKIPYSTKGSLYFLPATELNQYSGMLYHECKDLCYYDENQGLLCIGDVNRNGDCVEFVENTYAVINHNNLVAVYLKVDEIKNNCTVKKGHVYMK